MLPGRAAPHVFQKVHPCILEFVSDHPKAQKENAHVVLGACRVVGALFFGGGAGRGLGFRRNREAKLNVGLDLSGVGRAVEKPEFDRARPPHIVEVDVAVAGPS